jgi:hypothetical protein
MDELETMAWLDALINNGKPPHTIPSWQPYEVIEPLSDTDLNAVIDAAAQLYDEYGDDPNEGESFDAFMIRTVYAPAWAQGEYPDLGDI